jgi:hypothetical protein
MSAEEIAWLTSSKERSRRAKFPWSAGTNCQTSAGSRVTPTPNYTKEEEQWAKDKKGIKEKGSWWKLPDKRLCP